ncbi:uncharacterized protein LOC132785380 [Drosophila nasuta]|uniref:uncharacterized protein LOC132785380 n=1 Tax=Drosophila nasuta TaxID=42062 RepID=UPI00295EA226|nr:uncharacterized protein LOC132785380 [Drosophila nasuta]
MLSDYELDKLFVKQISSVTRIVKNLPENDAVLSACTRWFQILQKAKKDEKFERNYILLMLHRQLNDSDTLGFPFNDERQNELQTVYQMTLKPADSDDNDDDIQASSSSSNCRCIACTDSKSHQNEDQYQRLSRLNDTLGKELQVLQSKLNILTERRKLCLVKIDDMQKANRMFQKDIDNMKKIFLSSPVTALKKLTLNECPRFFSLMFKGLCQSAQDNEKFRQLDERLEQVLREHINHRSREAVWQEITKEYDALRAEFDRRYKKIIEDQETTQFQELSFYGKKCLMILKTLFIDSFNGEKQLKSNVIAYLDKQYETLHRK